jgi:hypothetical protein
VLAPSGAGRFRVAAFFGFSTACFALSYPARVRHIVAPPSFCRFARRRPLQQTVKRRVSMSEAARFTAGITAQWLACWSAVSLLVSRMYSLQAALTSGVTSGPLDGLFHGLNARPGFKPGFWSRFNRRFDFDCRSPGP